MASIPISDELLPKLEKIAFSMNRTANDLAQEILEQYIRRQSAVSNLEELSSWGRQHAADHGFKPSDVFDAISDFRRDRRTQ